uniref:Class 3 lipase n=1 Tax=Linum usitatissimum TaxID=4006 RepID=I6YMA1_LINUS|nr:class 3 lipase [Linum usitatissimum]
MCRYILSVYEDDLFNPQWEPPGGYGINPDCVKLKRTYLDTQGRAPPYLLYLDHKHSDIVLAIRGLNLARESDYKLLLDNKLGEMKVAGGYVHNGLMKAASWILESECEVLKEVLRDFSSYSLTFAGHSLGAGVAAMLALVVVLNGGGKLGCIERKRIRCFAIAPARCPSEIYDGVSQTVFWTESDSYEDARRTSNAGNFSENAQINKSINALFKNPFSCQDSINMLNLASRCCQSTDRVGLDPARKTNSTTRSKVFASHKSRLPGTGSVSSMRKQQTPSNLPVPGRKAGGNASALKARKLFDEKYHEKSEKKRNHPVIASVTELCSQEEVCSSSISLTTAASSVQEARLSYGTQEVSSTNFEDIPSVSFDVQESLSIEVSGPCTSTTSIDTVSVEQSVDNPVDITPATKTLSVVEEGRSLDEKENDKSLVNEGESPPISARLQEISNTLKQLFKSTPSYEAIPFSNDPSLLQYQTSTPSKGPLTPELDRTANDIMDFETEIPSSDDPSVLQDQTSTPSIGPLTPKLNTTANDTLDFVKTIAHTTNDPSPPISTISIEPRTPECNIRRANNNTLDIASFCSPWEKLNRSNCGVKNSLVQEYLSFINTANKEDLKKLKGIGEKRAAYIMELREDSPFKDLDELKDVGMSAKQIKDMMGKNVAAGLFS